MKATQSKILSSIEQVRKRLESANLLLDWNQSVVENTQIRGRKRVTWAVAGTLPDILSESNSNIREYLTFLEVDHYAFSYPCRGEVEA